jgi:exonuclease SbcC
MKHLKKITISNARRFGKDVEIDLSPGANIFLAPNGTGKTTLFEAIEFALTGSIQRLASPPLSLIRDKQNDVDVRLDFDNGNFCEVNYRKGEEPKLSGDHFLLFPKHTIQDIPFLLRLTHLIEQRGNNWFIQKHESGNAGELLDKLSIGKELSAISKTKSTTLNAATRTINEKKEKKNAHLLVMSSFENKIKERDAAKLTYDLKPLDEILNEIQRIHRIFSESAAIINEGSNLEAVTSYKGLVNSVLIKSIEDNEQILLKLSNLDSKIPLFNSNKKELEEKQKEVLEKENIVPVVLSEINIIKGEILKLQEHLNKTKDIQTVLQKSKQLVNKKKEEEIRLKITEDNIKSASDLIPAQKEKLNQENQLVEKLSTDIAKFKLIRQSEEEAIRKQGEIISLQSIIDNWNTNLTKISGANTGITNLTPQQEKLQKTIEALQDELQVVENKLKESQNKISSLKSASESILSAVGIISANLPEDQGNCPVCSAVYDPIILREKIALALKEINPVVSSEIETSQGFQRGVEQKKQQIRQAKIELDRIIIQLAENADILKSAQAFINEKCLPKFPNLKTINEAEVFLKNEKEENDNNLQNIIINKNALGQEPSPEDLNTHTSSRDQIIVAIQSLETNISTLNASLEIIKGEIAKINSDISTIDLEQLDTKMADAEKEIENVSKEITSRSRDQEHKENKKKEVEGQLIELKMTISTLQGQQDVILTQWKEAGLLNTPSVEALSLRKETLVQHSDSIKKSIEALDKLGEELGRWTASEKLDALNKEIKMLCGDSEEQIYLAQLKEQDKAMELELSFITEKKKALDRLYNQINQELDTIHEQIKSINPLWVSLLKKIVVNPRFIDTHLNSYSYRNKPQAEVLINLHDAPVSVMEVASEAQATDLQLTFMLSMASKYKWTSWKSLLLDDPTQHHDLVHASGVFDLLRDYIIEQDFQILMGTHDSVQGKFFQRKLQNENVDVKLWRLIANDDGVRAEVIS